MTISDRTLVGLLRVPAVSAGTLAVIGSVVVIGTGRAGSWWPFGALTTLLSVFFAVFVWLVIPQQPQNAVVWTMAASAFFGGLYAAGWSGVTLIIDDPNLFIGSPVVPADLPLAAAWILVFIEPSWVGAIVPLMTFGLLLFPDGKLPSPRWRWVGVSAIVGIVLTGLGAVWSQRPWNTDIAQDDLLLGVGQLVFLLAAVAALVALVVRFRRSSGEIRQQLKWIVWGSSIFVLVVIVSIVLGGGPYGELTFAALVVAGAIFCTSYGIAVGRYRLYDIDLVISKTVAFVSLAAVIAVLYVAAVLGLVALFGEPNQGPADLRAGFWFGATALVAIGFEPLRVRLQRWADRVAFGKRAAPHHVLSQLTSQLSDTSSSEGLVGLAQLLRDGTAAGSALVWLRVGDRLRVEAVSPADALPAISVVEAEEDLPASELEVSVPVRHGGELLGALGVTKPRSHPVTPADEALLSDVAAGAGLLLRNLRLNAELARRAVELQASRRRLITAHDAARHRLERDLHDGAQQQVVALKVRLGLAKTIAEREGAHDLAARVAELAEGTQHAVDAMRIVARGIYPPLLDAEGLGPALAAMHRAVDLPLQIDVGSLPRYSKEAEETAYFCVLAAVTQATMAAATTAQIDVEGDDMSLALTVSYNSAERDDLAALTDRVDAFGGTVATSTSADRMTITMTLPVEDEIMEPA